MPFRALSGARSCLTRCPCPAVYPMLAFDAPTKAVGAVVCAAMLVTGAFDEDLSRGLTELIGSK